MRIDYLSTSTFVRATCDINDVPAGTMGRVIGGTDRTFQVRWPGDIVHIFSIRTTRVEVVGNPPYMTLREFLTDLRRKTSPSAMTQSVLGTHVIRDGKTVEVRQGKTGYQFRVDGRRWRKL